jgi:O-antigen chain-terminating methyltransferase
MLAENNVLAYGMDLDESMLAACLERQLQAVHGDAVEHLKSLKNQSLLAVSCIHVAEHLRFDVLQALIAEIQRVLVPGGLIILETPNPENLVVGTASFYIDPSHQQPLPSQLLLFLVKHHGYARIKLLRLQEEDRLREGGPTTIYDVIAGASPDYAVIAQVAVSGSEEQVNGTAFSSAYGVSLFELAERYDRNNRQVFLAQQQQAQITQNLVADAQNCADQANAKADEARRHAADACRQAAEAVFLAREAQEQLAAILARRSWRLTRLLSWFARQFRSRSGGN